MLSATTNYRNAFVTLFKKGYDVDGLCVFDSGATGDAIHEEYLKCPMECITFKGFAELPNVPADFELAHIMDEEHSLLICRYEDGLSAGQLLDKREEVSEALLYWAEQLP